MSSSGPMPSPARSSLAVLSIHQRFSQDDCAGTLTRSASGARGNPSSAAVVCDALGGSRIWLAVRDAAMATRITAHARQTRPARPPASFTQFPPKS